MDSKLTNNKPCLQTAKSLLMSRTKCLSQDDEVDKLKKFSAETATLTNSYEHSTLCRKGFDCLLKNAVESIICHDDDLTADDSLREETSENDFSFTWTSLDGQEDDPWNSGFESICENEQEEVRQTAEQIISSSLAEQTKRHVGFDSVYIRVYDQILCDNPCATEGPSLGLGWGFEEKSGVALDDYERKRAGNFRRGSQLLMPACRRKEIAKLIGYTDTEIARNIDTFGDCRKRGSTPGKQSIQAHRVKNKIEAARRQVAKMYVESSQCSRIY